MRRIVKMIELMNGLTIWYPTEYNYRNIRKVWIEEEMNAEEFKEYLKNHTVWKNRS
jgi:hypothetical protein